MGGLVTKKMDISGGKEFIWRGLGIILEVWGQSRKEKDRLPRCPKFQQRMITAGKASVATFWLFDEAGGDESPSSGANTKPKTGIQGLNTETGGLSRPISFVCFILGREDQKKVFPVPFRVGKMRQQTENNSSYRFGGNRRCKKWPSFLNYIVNPFKKIGNGNHRMSYAFSGARKIHTQKRHEGLDRQRTALATSGVQRPRRVPGCHCGRRR